MKKILWLLLVTLLWTGLTAVEAAPPTGDRPWYEPCRQIVWVVSEDWESPTGKLTALSKRESGWTIEIRNIDVTLGRNGLGVGEGIHPKTLSGPRKQEGDKRAPAGIFPLEFSFGKGTGPKGNAAPFSFRKAGKSDYWVDDPRSAYYNRWVNLEDEAVNRDWSSVDVLARSDGIYDLAIVVGHNRREFLPGKGSAIFMHRWYAPGKATIGCTAMSPEHLEQLWRWLDERMAPVLVQAPRGVLRELPLPDEVRKLLAVESSR